ncbi:DUF1189 family protein [Sporosarcina sp. CAU 1771]
MKFHQIVSASLNQPKKLAAFRLLPIGKVFSYVFIFVAFFTGISFIRFIGGDVVLFENSPELMEHAQTIGSLIYPIAFLMQLVIGTFYIFIRITIFAYVGVLLIKVFKRRGQFLHIWRTSAIALTVPILITVVFDLFPIVNGITSTFITSIVHIIYIALAVQYYPKQSR